MNAIVPIRRAMAALAAILVFGALSLAPAFSGHAYAAATAHHRHLNWVQRHPTLTSIGAGVATHHALKVAARNAKMHGKKLNWAERHPTLSAVGVGAVTHHEIKAHTPK